MIHNNKKKALESTSLSDWRRFIRSVPSRTVFTASDSQLVQERCISINNTLPTVSVNVDTHDWSQYTGREERTKSTRRPATEFEVGLFVLGGMLFADPHGKPFVSAVQVKELLDREVDNPDKVFVEWVVDETNKRPDLKMSAIKDFTCEATQHTGVKVMANSVETTYDLVHNITVSTVETSRPATADELEILRQQYEKANSDGQQELSGEDSNDY